MQGSGPLMSRAKNADDVDRFDLLPGMSKTICNTTQTADNWDDNQFADNPGASSLDNCLLQLAKTITHFFFARAHCLEKCSTLFRSLRIFRQRLQFLMGGIRHNCIQQ